MYCKVDEAPFGWLWGLGLLRVLFGCACLFGLLCRLLLGGWPLIVQGQGREQEGHQVVETIHPLA